MSSPVAAAAAAASAATPTSPVTKKRKVSSDEDESGNAAAAPTVCTFDRCSHPIAKDGVVWCAQHARVVHVGEKAMLDAYGAYDSSVNIWEQIEKRAPGIKAEALYAYHRSNPEDPLNRAAIGRCFGCNKFSIAHHFGKHGRVYCRACLAEQGDD